MANKNSCDTILNMARRESHTPISGGASLRAMERERRALDRAYNVRENLRRREAVTGYFCMLEKANSSVSLGSMLEVVYPYTKLGRILSPRKGQMIPAVINNLDGRSTFVEWEDYRKITGRYLLVKEAVGYVITPTEEQGEFGRTDVVFQDGRVGSLLKPGAKYPNSYTYGRNEVNLSNWGDVFERRNCQAVWGPSIFSPEQLTSFKVERLTQLLSGLIVDIPQE